jgi:hypothetical protein
VDVEAVGGGAGLPAAAELRDHRAVDRGVEVRVLEDDERRVAPQLHRGVQDAVGALPQQRAARRRWSR